MRPKILLGLTGSVATVLYAKLISALQDYYDVDVVLTKSSHHFITGGDDFARTTLMHRIGVEFAFEDDDEWKFNGEVWTKGERVLHIELRDQYSALVIAPCSANTLAKLANGLCDNLLTSIARAWDPYKPLIIAPAMNTQMWDHPITRKHLIDFLSFSSRNKVVHPQAKMLACNTEGMGALANIKDIVEKTREMLRWKYPLGNEWVDEPGFRIPMTPHPGAFGFERKGYRHTGIDLYANDGDIVSAVEDGVIVDIEAFTGPSDNTPWWNDTECVMVKGASGVVNYGEISPVAHVSVGRRIRKGECIGYVKRVILKGHEHPEITGWKPSMLHLELYRYDVVKPEDDFSKVIDPTPFLVDSATDTITELRWEKPKP